MAEKWEGCLRFLAVAAFNLLTPQIVPKMSRTQSWVLSGAFSHTFTHILRAHQIFASFHNRSHGQRGADVETLRGTSGANYEGEAKVKRGGSSNGFCGCFGGSSDGEPVSLV